jgi:RNA recognition motif-containing protein
MASNTLFVSNFPFTTTEADLREMFEAFGDVNSVRIILDRETGRSRGFAFVELIDPAPLDSAIDALNNSEFHGRRLVVSKARGRAAADAGPPRTNDRPQPMRRTRPPAEARSDVVDEPFRHRIVIDWDDSESAYRAEVPELGVSAQGATIEAAIRQVQSRARGLTSETQSESTPSSF